MAKTLEDYLKKIEEEINAGDLKEVQLTVLKAKQLGFDVNQPLDPDSKQNILHVACYAGHYDIVQYFLSQEDKPDVNARDKFDWTPLLCAASIGHVELCNLLLNNGADPKASNRQQTSVLHYLCRRTPDDKDIKKEKKKKDSKINFTKDDSMSFVYNSAYTSLLSTLIERGVDLNQKNEKGETPLMQAAQKGNDEAVMFLLANKADWKLTNLKGETAMFYAENAGYENIVNIFKKKMEQTRIQRLNNNIKLENYNDVINLMKANDSGVPLKVKKYLFVTYNRVFEGYELIDWMLKSLPIRNREDAAQYGQKLLDLNLIVRIGYNRKKFEDSTCLCRFGTNEIASSDSPNELTSVKVDDFEKLQILGEGAFGKVVLVKKKDNGKTYAMKIMDKSKILNKPRDFKNLMREKKILQNDCPFLVHLYYAFQNETNFYLVMDYVGGGDLHYHLNKIKHFSEKVVQFIAAELIIALSYLHSRGVIYRDLKPHNILFEIDGHICLTDFGLSKEVGSNIEMAMNTACGTPSYSAIEVLEGRQYGKGADFWSLGILIYQLLVGKVPFKFEGQFHSLIQRIYSNEISFPEDLVSPNAQALIRKLIVTDTNKRLDDADIIKRHPFFKQIDWEALEVKRVTPPLKLAEDSNIPSKYKGIDPNSIADSGKIPQRKIDGFTLIF